MTSSLTARVMAQNLPPGSEPFPTILRFEGLLPRPALVSPGAQVRHSQPYASAPVVDFESNDGNWAVTRTLRFSTNSNNDGLWGNLMTSISVSSDNPSSTANRDKFPVAPSQNKFSVATPQNKVPVTTTTQNNVPVATPQNKFSQVPSGVNIGYGLSYYLPVSQTFSAFAQLKPPSIKSIFAFKNVFTAPQTMVAAGFYLPIIATASPTGHNVSLKFSAAVDQQFRPIMSVTINLTPSRK